MKNLRDLTDTKLHADEAAVVRAAADALFFCEDLSSDPDAEVALRALYDLTDALVDSERMTAEAATRMTAEVEACGPFTAVT